MRAVTQGGYSCQVGEDVGECGAVPGIARARVGSHEAQESHFGRGRELSVVPVARQEHEFRHHHCYHPIGFIAGSYGGIISAVGHFVYKIGFPTVPSSQPGCLRDTGVSLTYNPA